LNTIQHMRGVFSYVQGSPAPFLIFPMRGVFPYLQGSPALLFYLLRERFFSIFQGLHCSVILS
jgi:hypothetical protein